MRLIDGDALKAEILHRRRQAKTLTGVDMVMLIDDFPTVNGWISVKDRLPRLRQWVLCKCRAGIYEVLRYEETCVGERWYHDNLHNYLSSFVTHWMPLTEPPQEDTI